MSERAFVTGGLGFLGTHLVKRLLAENEYVVVYDRKPAPVRVTDGMPWVLPSNDSRS